MVSKRLVAANPRLIGMRALDVLVEVFKTFEDVGLALWLDRCGNHHHMVQMVGWHMVGMLWLGFSLYFFESSKSQLAGFS